MDVGKGREQGAVSLSAGCVCVVSLDINGQGLPTLTVSVAPKADRVLYDASLSLSGASP